MSINVWHNNLTFSAERDRPAVFPTDFTLVATVATDKLGEAYERTNTIWGPWWDNEGVTTTETSRHGARSTSVGDVLELADGTLKLVKGIGFGNVPGMTVDWRDAR